MMPRNKKGQYRKLTIEEALKGMLDNFGNKLIQESKKDINGS